MTTMQINGSESGIVRLFHLDLPPEAVERFATQAGTGEWPLKYALGAARLRPAFVEVVAIRDLGQMPLSAYLAEAYDLRGEDIRQMHPRIDTLRGHVLILPSQAFDHVTQELSIASPLRWIGTFSEDTPAPRRPRLSSDAAKGTVTGQAAPATRPPRSLALRLTLIGLAVLVLLILAFAFRPAG